MTINLADNSPRISYAVAQGATQTSFAVPFEFFASADLNVYVDGTLKTLTTHYTVSGGDGSTGTVTISVTGATGGSTVVITRDVALERTTDFPSSGPFQIGALNTELDRLTAIAADLDDKAGRALQLTDFDVAASLVLPTVDNRKGKTLAFNASSGAVEAGPTISDVQTVSAAAADIQTLAHIEDGTDATDAIQTVAGIASNVSTVAGVSSAVSTVAGISSNVTAVAADATDIGVVAGKATEIGRLGTADAVSDLNTLGTADAVSDMNTLAAISANISTVASISANVTSVAGVSSLITSDFVADLNTLATTDIVSDLNTLATADIVSDLNTLATSDIVSDLNTLATADIVSDLNTLATTDIVSDLNTLATTDIVTDLNLLATSAIVEDLNLLATSTVIADMATLAGAGANPNISSLGVSGNITLADNGKAIFGAGSDLQIYHNGSDSFIDDAGTGSLYMRSNSVVLGKYTGEVGLVVTADGPVDLYHNDAKKLATTSTGVDITGNLLVTGNAEAVVSIQGTTAGGSFVNFGDPNDTDVGQIGYDHTSNYMRFKTNDTERMRISSDGSVGIGSASDGAILQLDKASSSYFDIQSDSTLRTRIYNDSSQTILETTTNNLIFKSASSEAMRLDASGNLLVGKASTSSNVAGHRLNPRGDIEATRSGGLVSYFNRQSSDGDISVFAKDGTTVGSIQARSSFTTLQIGSTGTGITGTSSHKILPSVNNARSDNTNDLGDSSYRWKDLYLSGSIEIENGTANVGVGRQALNSNTGSNNTALGFQAGYTNVSGSYNAFIGKAAGYNSTSDFNTYIGHDAGLLMTSGNKNTILGRFNGNQGGLDIRTSNNNIVLSDGAGNPRMRIDSSGDIGIGDTNPTRHTQATRMLIYNGSTTAADAALHCSRNGTGTEFQVAFSNAYGVRGTITTTASAVSYNTTSDHRLKENVVDLTGATDRLKQLEPKRFNFIVDDTTTVDGFLAHEVQTVVPEAVYGTHNEVDADGNPVYQGIDQSKLVPLLVATIKELEARITALENA